MSDHGGAPGYPDAVFLAKAMTPQQDVDLFRKLQEWLSEREGCEAPIELAASEMDTTSDVIRNIAGPDGYNQLGIANYDGVEWVYADGE